MAAQEFEKRVLYNSEEQPKCPVMQIIKYASVPEQERVQW